MGQTGKRNQSKTNKTTTVAVARCCSCRLPARSHHAAVSPAAARSISRRRHTEDSNGFQQAEDEVLLPLGNLLSHEGVPVADGDRKCLRELFAASTWMILEVFKGIPPLLNHSPALQKREAVRLYRDILRASKTFVWESESGHPWSLILRQSARKEFESSKEEKDPEEIARLLVTGRDCLDQTIRMFNQELEKVRREVDKSRNS